MMKERIRKVREQTGLSMEKFGARIGIGKTSISLLESGKNNPSAQTISLICREFNVNEQWLRTGEGEMFEQTRESVLDRLSAEYDLDREQRAVIESFLDLTPAERDVILKYVHKVYDHATSAPSGPPGVPDAKAEAVAGDPEFQALREKSEPAENESSTTAG